MRTAAICLITLYQWCISPLFPPQCRFVPPCSEYARIAVERYGLWRGAALTLGRLLRCHPLCAGGFDPVPETEETQPAPTANTPLRRKGSS